MEGPEIDGHHLQRLLLLGELARFRTGEHFEIMWEWCCKTFKDNEDPILVEGVSRLRELINGKRDIKSFKNSSHSIDLALLRGLLTNPELHKWIKEKRECHLSQ